MPRQAKHLPRPGSIAISIRAAMLTEGLSITELSGIADLSRPTLSYFLSGRRNLSVAQLERLLLALGRRRLEAVCRAISIPR